MTRRVRKAMLASLLVVAGWPSPGEARVVRFVVEQTRPVAEGKSFGDAGPYERLDGTVYIEVDPRDPLNTAIVNLDKAPQNAERAGRLLGAVLHPQAGRHGARQPEDLLRHQQPRQQARLRVADDPAAHRPPRQHQQQPVDRRRLRRRAAACGSATSYVDAGWQGNVAPGNDRLVPNLPVATEADGRPIVATRPRRVRRCRGLHPPARGQRPRFARPTRPPTSTRRDRR